MTLAQQRAAIDALDVQILRLLNERAEQAIAARAEKLRSGGARVDAAREAALTARLCANNGGPLDAAALEHIYAVILEEMRRAQDKAEAAGFSAAPTRANGEEAGR